MEALYFSRAANTFNNYLSSVHELYIYHAKKNQLPTYQVPWRESHVLLLLFQLSWITYVLEMHSCISHQTPGVDILNIFAWLDLWGGWTCLTPAGFTWDDSWLLSAWGMAERASQGELALPWHWSPPEHLPSEQELTPSPCSEWRHNSLLLSKC